MNSRKVIPTARMEEVRRLNQCIEEATEEWERELYRSIKKTPADYDMLHRLVEDSMKRVKELQQKQKGRIQLP